MKVLLVVYDNASYTTLFPQGLAYVTSALQNAGHTVELLNQDQWHYPDAYITHYLDKHRFDMVGVSVSGGYYPYRKLLSISEAINRSKQRPVYVIGGHGPAPEPAFFLRKTGADIAVIGEGEETVVELMQALEAGSSLAAVQGIAYREDDQVEVNPRRPLCTDVDSIAWPAYERFPMEYYRMIRMPNCSATDFVMPVLSGRGCPFKCTFCYRLDEGFRPRQGKAIVEEIKYLKKHWGITYVAFTDELLMSSRRRTVEICEEFLSAELDIKWDCCGRLNYATPEVLKLMKRAGCVFINYGIEAMDNEVLKKMRKGLNTDMVIKGVEATLDVGISPGLNIIFGNLGDTKETLQKGVDFLLQYDDLSQFRTIRPVTPYPGCELYHRAIEQGLLKDCEDFYENKHLNSDLVSVNFTELSDEEFHRCLHQANSQLINNHFEKKRELVLKQADELYLDGNTEFRGFRQI